MNCFFKISVMRVRMVGRLNNIPALDGVLAAAVTRWPAGCSRTRMMSTEAARDYDNGPKAMEDDVVGSENSDCASFMAFRESLKMNYLRAVRRLADGNNGSMGKLYIGDPMAGLVKPIASRSFTRMMSTSAAGKKKKTSGNKDDQNISEKLKQNSDDDAVVAAESTKSTVLFLEEFPLRRNEFEMKLMFYGWCQFHKMKIYEDEAEEKERYAIFKDRVRFIEEFNARNLSFRVLLDSYSDNSHEELLPAYESEYDSESDSESDILPFELLPEFDVKFNSKVEEVTS